MATVVFGFLIIPQLLLIIGDAAVSSDGFLDSIIDDLDLMWQVGLVSIVYLAAFAPLAFLISSFAAKQSFAAGIFLAIMFIVSGVTRGLVEAEFDVFGLLSINHHPRYVADWILDVNSRQWIPEQAGFEPRAASRAGSAASVRPSTDTSRRDGRNLRCNPGSTCATWSSSCDRR